MDPKQSSNPPLDPKLQQAYDKVMGVNLTDPSAPAGAVPVTPPGTIQSPTSPTADPAVTPPTPPVDPMATPIMPATPVSTPPVVDPMATVTPAPDPMTAVTPASSTSPVGPTVTVSVPPAIEPSSPTMPTPPATPDPTLNPASPGTIQSPAAPQDSMSATITMPTHHASETVKIGIGGSPVAAVAKAKHKGGISPVILIFGALAFLVVYGVFWIKFFGYNLPFLNQ